MSRTLQELYQREEDISGRNGNRSKSSSKAEPKVSSEVSARDKTGLIAEGLEDQAKGFELYSVSKRKSLKIFEWSSGICRTKLLTIKPETAWDKLEQVKWSQDDQGGGH